MKMIKPHKTRFITILCQARGLKGFTQEQLAKKCGVSRVTITHLENGKRLPSFDLLIKLAHALDIEPSTFL